MDALSGLLDGPRARDSFLRAKMRPWGIRIRRGAAVARRLVAGDAWVVLDDGSAPTRLGTGDLAILRGPDHYTMADDPATPVQVVCHPGQVCTTPDGVPVTEAMTLGVRTWGNDPDGPVTMLVGTYRVGAVSRRLVDALPPLAVVRHDDWSSPLPDLLGDEIVKDEPGQDLVLDRLLDLLLVAVLRAWLAPRPRRPPGTGRTRTRWSARRCATCTTTRPVPGPCRRRRRHRRVTGGPGPPVHGGGGRAPDDSSPAGAWPWPPTRCASPGHGQRGPPGRLRHAVRAQHRAQEGGVSPREHRPGGGPLTSGLASLTAQLRCQRRQSFLDLDELGAGEDLAVLGPQRGPAGVGQVGGEGVPVGEPQQVDLDRERRALPGGPAGPVLDPGAVVGQQREDGVLVGVGVAGSSA